MQHRRAASDTTAFLFKGGLADLLNEGPAGDHSSPSITPMLSHLNKSTGRPLCHMIVHVLYTTVLVYMYIAVHACKLLSKSVFRHFYYR